MLFLTITEYEYQYHIGLDKNINAGSFHHYIEMKHFALNNLSFGLIV